MYPLIECSMLYDPTITWVTPFCDAFLCTGEEIEQALEDNEHVDLTGLGTIGGLTLDNVQTTITSSDTLEITGPITLRNGTVLTLCGVEIEAYPGVLAVDSAGSTLNLDYSSVVGGRAELLNSALVLNGSSWQGAFGQNGGAIYADASYVTLTSGALLSNNTAQESGGAIYLTQGSLLETLPLGPPIQFLGNEAVESGGAIYAEDATLLLSNTLFSGDPDDTSARLQARNGGAIAADGGTLFLWDITFEDLLAESGGALYATEAFVTTTDAHFRDTAATKDGGAVWIEAGASGTRLSLLDVCETHADGLGGAFYLACDDANEPCVVDHILAANPSASNGSLLYLDDGDAFIDHATVVGAASGPLVTNDGGALSFRNSIVDLQSPVPLIDGGVDVIEVDDAAQTDVVWMSSLAGDRFVCGEASHEVRPHPGGPQMGRATTPASGAPGLELDEIGAFGHIPEPEEPENTTTAASTEDPDLLPLLLRANRDFDIDGVPWRYDCDERDLTIGYGLPELCSNGIDDDCDGLVDLLDEGCATTTTTTTGSTDSGPPEDDDKDLSQMRWAGGCSVAPHRGAALLSLAAALLALSRRARID